GRAPQDRRVGGQRADGAGRSSLLIQSRPRGVNTTAAAPTRGRRRRVVAPGRRVRRTLRRGLASARAPAKQRIGAMQVNELASIPHLRPPGAFSNRGMAPVVGQFLTPARSHSGEENSWQTPLRSLPASAKRSAKRSTGGASWALS